MIDFINEEYLNANDQKFNDEMNKFFDKWLEKNIPFLKNIPSFAQNLVSELLSQLREKIGKPLFKKFAKFLLDIWLKIILLILPNNSSSFYTSYRACKIS